MTTSKRTGSIVGLCCLFLVAVAWACSDVVAPPVTPTARTIMQPRDLSATKIIMAREYDDDMFYTTNGTDWTAAGTMAAGSASGNIIGWDGTVYGAATDGIYQWDGATTWTHVLTTTAEIGEFAVFGGALFASTYYGDGGHTVQVYRTTDGTDWSAVFSHDDNCLDVPQLYATASALYSIAGHACEYYNPVGEYTQFATRYYVSSNGTSWSTAATIFQDVPYYDENNNLQYYVPRFRDLAQTGGGTWVATSDLGWSIATAGSLSDGSFAGIDTTESGWSETIHEANGVLLTTHNGTTVYSTNGTTWSNVGGSNPGALGEDSELSADADGYLYLAPAGEAVYRSTDNGVNWSVFRAGSHYGVTYADLDVNAPTPTNTPTATATATPTATPTATNTPTPTNTWTPENTATPSATPNANLMINEVCPNADTDLNRSGGIDKNDNAVELYGVGPGNILLTGWVLASDTYSATLPATKVISDSFKVFFGGDLGWSIPPTGTLTLTTPWGATVDTFPYPTPQAAGKCCAREPDGNSTINCARAPSLGKTNP